MNDRKKNVSPQDELRALLNEEYDASTVVGLEKVFVIHTQNVARASEIATRNLSVHVHEKLRGTTLSRRYAVYATSAFVLSSLVAVLVFVNSQTQPIVVVSQVASKSTSTSGTNQVLTTNSIAEISSLAAKSVPHQGITVTAKIGSRDVAAIARDAEEDQLISTISESMVSTDLWILQESDVDNLFAEQKNGL